MVRGWRLEFTVYGLGVAIRAVFVGAVGDEVAEVGELAQVALG